jgi:hypothetical protein
MCHCFCNKKINCFCNNIHEVWWCRMG